jgi:protein TonB
VASAYVAPLATQTGPQPSTLPSYRLPSPHDRPPLRRRASGLALALGVNLGLLFVLLGLGVRLPPPAKSSGALVVDLLPEARKAENRERKAEAVQSRRPRPVPRPPRIRLPAKPTISVERPLPIIELTHEEYAAADVRALPKAAPSAPAEDDSPEVGRGPNGETLYAAEWAREPTDTELSFYLPKDAPDGYGLIACKTYPRFRVDDCVALESHPASSHLARAVLNAAWQFKVKPPRKNGKPMIGEWVRIKIEYIHSGKGG